MIRKRFDTIVFDLDGTLIDSEPGLRHALNLTLLDLGCNPVSPDAVKSMLGDGIPKLVERALLANGRLPSTELDDVVKRFSKHYFGIATTFSKIFPGVVSTLSSLKGMGLKLGICTNRPEAPTYEILNAFNISAYIDTVVAGDTIPGIKKPDSRHLATVLEHLKASPNKAAMIGDSLNDSNAARELEIPFIAVSFGYFCGPHEELKADILIEHFEELERALHKLSINS